MKIPQILTLIRKMLFYSSRTSSVSQAKILNDIINKKAVYHTDKQLFIGEPLVGFEPTTPRLQITCSGQLS